MDLKTAVKNLITSTSKGNFENVLNTIKSNKLQLDTPSAIKILVTCCNACISNQTIPNNLLETDLVDLLKCLLDFIESPASHHFECYLQSAFHILKFLQHKKCYSCVLELEDFFAPSFTPATFTHKQLNVYQSICSTLYNSIAKFANSKDENCADSALKLSYFLATLYKKIKKFTILLEVSHNCLIALACLNTKPEDLAKLYLHVIKIVDIEEDSTLYRPFMNGLSYIVVHLLKENKPKLAHNLFLKTQEKLKSMFKGEEFSYLHNIVQIIEWIIPIGSKNETLDSCLNDIQIYSQKYAIAINLISACDLISSVASVASHFDKKTNNSQWLFQLKPEVHLKYFQLLMEIALIMAEAPHDCSCKKCPIKTNINEALRCLNTVAYLAKTYLTHNSEVSQTYKMDILRHLTTYTNYLLILKHNSCVRWKNCWYDAGVYLYNIGIHLSRNHDFVISELYLQKFIKLMMEHEGIEPTIITKMYLNAALTSLADGYIANKNYEKSLFVIALNIVIDKEYPRLEINRWIKTKVASRDNNNLLLQEWTLVSVFEHCKSELLHYFQENQPTLDRKTQIELLIYELSNYKSKWKSKVPMMATYRHLCQLADPDVLAGTFLEIWEDGDLHVHENIPKLLHDTIKKVELYKGKIERVQMAQLYYLQHKYRLEEALVKHCDEMEKTMNLNQTLTHSGPIPPDPNDDCDIVSSYDCLKVSTNLKIMKNLDKALEVLCQVLTGNYLNECTDQDRLYKLYKLLTKIAHQYKLDNHTIKSLQAWEFALKIGDHLENKMYYLQAAGFLVEFSDVGKSFLKTIIKKADEIAWRLQGNYHNIQVFEAVIVYYLCKVDAYFYVDFNAAYDLFQLILKLCDNISINYILKARINLCHHKFIMLPCKFNVNGHKDYSLVKIHQAQYDVVKYYTETQSLRETPYEMRIFFDVSEALVKMYLDMRLPREVRCYSKEVITIAQKMALPFRTASFLSYLSQADIYSSRLDDARVKIMDLSDILDLIKFKSISKQKNPKSSKIVKFNDVMEGLVCDFNQIMLDVPKRKPVSPIASPKLQSENFKIPPFLHHDDDCACYYCTSLEYHQFVFKKTYLHALLFEYENNIDMAGQFFIGCLKIFEYLKAQSGVYMKKLQAKLTPDLVNNPIITLMETYCLILFEYGNFCLRHGKITDARNINKKLLCALHPYKLRYINIYNEALAQKLDILIYIPFERRLEIKHQVAPTVDLNVAMTEISTPESKTSKVLISPQIKYPMSGVKPKNITKIHFDLSDDDDNDDKMKKKKVTASSSKIKIYTNKSTGSKRKNVLSDIPTPSGTPLNSSTFLIPQTANTYTPNVKSVDSKINSHLAHKTKLLTEKLKKSTRKCELPEISINNENIPSCSKPGKVGKKSNVRQNLLNQLEGAEESDMEEGPRRSRRQRKQ